MRAGKRAPHSCAPSACLGCVFPAFGQIMPGDIHLIFPFPSWCPFKVLQSHRPGSGPAVLVWVEVPKKTNPPKPFIPNQQPHPGTGAVESSLTAFVCVLVKVAQLCGQNFCLATLSCQGFICPRCSETHVRAACTDGRGSDL